MLPWASWFSIKDRHHAFRHHFFRIRGHGISMLSRKRKRPRLPSKQALEPARKAILAQPKKQAIKQTFG